MSKRKIEGLIEYLKTELENDYKMSYDEMEKCYYKNDYVMDYHVGVSYVAGMEEALEIVGEKK